MAGVTVVTPDSRLVLEFMLALVQGKAGGTLYIPGIVDQAKRLTAAYKAHTEELPEKAGGKAGG